MGFQQSLANQLGAFKRSTINQYVREDTNLARLATLSN